MLTFRTKDDLSNSNEKIDWYDNLELLENENNLKKNLYLLHFEKCKYDGELDQTKPFLKLNSISPFNEMILDQVEQLTLIFFIHFVENYIFYKVIYF